MLYHRPNGVGITDLGTLGGRDSASGINNAGQVVLHTEMRTLLSPAPMAWA